MNKIPYFEMKVVKVKKECEHLQIYYKPGMIGYRCHNCGKLVDVNSHEIKKYTKGTWVNGENLDKIKFPVPCSYRSHTGKKRYALLNKDKNNGKDEYQLSRIFQDTCSNFFLASDSLKKLIRKWDIHILKGKIVIFENKEGD